MHEASGSHSHWPLWHSARRILRCLCLKLGSDSCVCFRFDFGVFSVVVVVVRGTGSKDEKGKCQRALGQADAIFKVIPAGLSRVQVCPALVGFWLSLTN